MTILIKIKTIRIQRIEDRPNKQVKLTAKLTITMKRTTTTRMIRTPTAQEPVIILMMKILTNLPATNLTVKKFKESLQKILILAKKY